MSEQPEKLQIAFLDVGQGDTIVISNPDMHEAIVVDCTNATAVLDYLAQEQIKYLRGILTSCSSTSRSPLKSNHAYQIRFRLTLQPNFLPPTKTRPKTCNTFRSESI